MASLPTPKSSASFWHSEPSDFLLGHQTSRTLPEEADVVIVGSGITGASAARFLAEDERAKGLSVVMLEAREACWGATGRNGGHCQALLFDRGPDVAAFELRNFHAIESYIADNDVACEWHAVPACRTFWTEALAAQAAKDVQQLKDADPEIGKEVTMIQNEEDIRKLRVNGAPGVTLTAVAASLWPYKLIAFMLEKLVKHHGLNLQTNTPVDKIELCKDNTEKPGSSVRHLLHTSRGSIRTQNVILATNAYTSHLLPPFSSLIVPERGTMTALIPPKGSKPLSNSYGFVGFHGANPMHDDYLNQRAFSGVPNPAGHLMFGGGAVAKTHNMVNEDDDSFVDMGSVAYLKKVLLQLLDLGGETEGLHELEATHAWSGIWGTSIDNHPWVGVVPNMEGVWLAGGYSGHGMPNAMLCGKAVVEMMLAEGSGMVSLAVQERLVKNGDLPQSYLITEERIDRCKQMDSVEVQEQKAAMWRIKREDGL